MPDQKESYLQSGITITKAVIVYIGVFLILMAGTLGSQGINQIQTALLTKYNGMQYFAMLTVLGSVGMVGMMPVGGKFADLFGKKVLLWIGGLVFTISSIIASFAPSLGTFLFFRAIIPVGQAITMVVSYAILADIFKGKGRNIAYSILTSALAIGFFLGGTIGGWLADIGMSWMVVFYPAVVSLIGVFLVSSQIINQKREGEIYIDYPGIILIMIFSIGLMYWTTFGAKAGWTNAMVLLSIAACLLSLVFFVIVEIKSREPLIPIFMFKNPIVVGILLVTIFTTFNTKPMGVYVPLMLQKVVGVSATVSGTVLLPRSIATIIFPAIIAAWAIKNLDTRIWKVLFLCGLSIAAAFFMISNTGKTTPLALYFTSFALLGIAESCKAAVITPFMQSVVEPKDVGAATALNSFFGVVGAVLSGCASGLLYNAVVPDPNNLLVLQRGLNQVFILTGVTGVIIALVAVSFVRSAQLKAVSKKNAAV